MVHISMDISPSEVMRPLFWQTVISLQEIQTQCNPHSFYNQILRKCHEIKSPVLLDVSVETTLSDDSLH